VIGSFRARGTLLGVALLVSSPNLTARAQSPQPEILDVVRTVDELYRSKSSYAEVTMEIVTPQWQRTLEMMMWTDGMDKTFIRILAPRKEKGVGTLRIGNEMWNFLPRTNKIMKVPPSMMTGSWMGSDFTNDDLVDEITYVNDYALAWADTDSAKADVFYIKATPHEDVPVVWGYILLAIRKNDYIPLWEKYFDEQDRLLRTFVFSDVRDFGARRLPSTMEVIPENKAGHKTVVRYTKATFDEPVDNGVFSIRNLRSP